MVGGSVRGERGGYRERVWASGVESRVPTPVARPVGRPETRLRGPSGRPRPLPPTPGGRVPPWGAPRDPSCGRQVGRRAGTQTPSHRSGRTNNTICGRGGTGGSGSRNPPTSGGGRNMVRLFGDLGPGRHCGWSRVPSRKTLSTVGTSRRPRPVDVLSRSFEGSYEGFWGGHPGSRGHRRGPKSRGCLGGHSPGEGGATY